MIKSFEVRGLFGKYNYQFGDASAEDAFFHPSANLFTGANGVGKTTLLKLMWYLISGHLRQALLEIPLEYACLTTRFGQTIIGKRISTARRPLRHFSSRTQSLPEGTSAFQVHIKKADGTNVFSRYWIPEEEIRNAIQWESPALPIDSVFLPTFRRIEGGYGMADIEELKVSIPLGMKFLSERMSRKGHRFVAYADFDDTQHIFNRISSEIRGRLQPFEEQVEQATSRFRADGSTQALREALDALEAARREAERPLQFLSTLVDDYFFEKSLRISEHVSLGSHPQQVAPSLLSAGEKNFFSLLIYALSLEEGVMFIDEPDLTLHVDWQRVLMEKIAEIAPRVQVFAATHSPAIYANAPGKDIWLDEYLSPHELARA